MLQRKIPACGLVLLFYTSALFAQTAQWECIGPDFLPAIGGDSSYFLSYTQGIGRTTCIRFHPLYNDSTNRTVYLGTPRGGLWRSYNGENQWKEMNTSRLPNTGISDLIFHPGDTSHLYIATGDPDGGLNPFEAVLGTEDTQSRGIYESSDAGKTWSSKPLGTWYDEQRKPLPDFWEFPSKKVMRKVFIHPLHPEVMLAILHTFNYSVNKFQSFIYRSADKGENWFVAFTYLNETFQDLEAKPGNPDVMFVSGKYLFRSTDAGISWQKAESENFPPDSLLSRCKIATCMAEPDFLYVLFEAVRASKLYISADGGATFNFKAQGIGSPAWRTALAVDQNDTGEVYYSAGNSVARFSNVGGKWRLKTMEGTTHADIHELAFAPTGSKLYVSSDGGLYVSARPGETGKWKYISNGIGNAAVWRIGASQKNPHHVIAGLQDCGTLLYDRKKYAAAGGWAIIRGGDGAESFIDHANDSVMYHNDGQNNVFARSNDKGRNWTTITPPGEAGDYIKPALLDPVDHKTVYVGFHDIYKSTDQGKTWKAISDFSSLGKAKADRVAYIAIAPSDRKVIYAAFAQPAWSETPAGKVFRSGDGGLTWQDVTAGLTGVKYSSINALAVDPHDAQTVYVGFHGAWDFKIMRSTESGADSSWQNYSEGLPKECDVDAIVIDKRKKGGLYIGTHRGVYERKKEYTGWIPFMDGSPLLFPAIRVDDLEINYTSSELFAATHGRGVWKTPLKPGAKTKKEKNK